MDISDNYDPQPAMQQQNSGQQPQHNTTNLNNPANANVVQMEMQTTASTTAIPLPAPQMHANLATKGHHQQHHPPAQNAAEVDIDSLLLQQFSCLGTTDHDDLITQFQNLMNNQMNKESAMFFLEMSNWNLQTAVGCYLDYYNFQPVPSMKIVEQSHPSQTQQAWRLQNSGTEDWPNGCYLLSPSQTRRIEVPAIKPGETCDILAELPAVQPVPVVWRLCTPNGWFFGETICLIPPGTCAPAELAEHMWQRSGGTINPEAFPQVNVVITVNME